jgi:ribosomal protein L7/L12
VGWTHYDNKEGVSKDEANAAKAKLEEAGAKVDVQ